MEKKRTPRGIRNNNPLNLRISNNNWIGKVQHNTDGAFEQFTSMEYGLRAAMINIKTIVRRRAKSKQATTVRELIHIWAPASDGNNEVVYCRTIANRTGIQPQDHVDTYSKNFLCLLVWAMAWQENGEQISMGRVENAWSLAFSPSATKFLQNIEGAGAVNAEQSSHSGQLATDNQ